MQDEGRKILTEFLGECWHEMDEKGPYRSSCRKCGTVFGAVHTSDWNPKAFYRTFDSWKDFGVLWDKIIEQEYLTSSETWKMLEHKTSTERCLIILEIVKKNNNKCMGPDWKRVKYPSGNE